MTEQLNFGRFEFPDGSIFEGCYETINGVNIRQGEGILSQPYREEYKGQWKDDQMHGYGTYNYTSGASYTGEWVNGRAQGKGVYEFQDGSIYDGQWSNHKMHGEGCYIDRSGNKYEGEFVEGVFQSKIQDQLKLLKIQQQKIKDIQVDVKTFFQKFDAKFQISDKKNIRDNLIHFFIIPDEISGLYSGSFQKFEDKQPQQWRDILLKFQDEQCLINVLIDAQSSKKIENEQILSPQLQGPGQIVEFQISKEKHYYCSLIHVNNRWALIQCIEE